MNSTYLLTSLAVQINCDPWPPLDGDEMNRMTKNQLNMFLHPQKKRLKTRT